MTSSCFPLSLPVQLSRLPWLALLAVLCLLVSRPVAADLIGVSWQDYDHLRQLSQTQGLDLRYVNGDIALFDIVERNFL